MKHLFLINSHTTFLTALGTINLLNLSKNEVVMVMVRNYHNDLDGNQYKQIDLSWAYSINRRKDFFRLRHLIKKIDDEIASLVENDQYLMYASSAGGLAIYQIIFSNPCCVGMNYLQEGAYVDKGLFEDYSLTISKRFFDYLLKLLMNHRVWASVRTWRMPQFLENKKTVPVTYAITQDFFSATNYKRYVVKWPSFEIPEEYKIEESYPCFVFEASVEWHLIEKNVYMKYCRQLINEKAESNNYIKFHPYQSMENKDEILNYFFDKKVKVQELSMDFPFEIYLSSYKDMKVNGFNSSLLIFAKQMGHTTYSLENLLIRESQKYRNICLQLGRNV